MKIGLGVCLWYSMVCVYVCVYMCVCLCVCIRVCLCVHVICSDIILLIYCSSRYWWYHDSFMWSGHVCTCLATKQGVNQRSLCCQWRWWTESKEKLFHNFFTKWVSLMRDGMMVRRHERCLMITSLCTIPHHTSCHR